jgi:steroid 5-alpha reductase family enzyme
MAFSLELVLLSLGALWLYMTTLFVVALLRKNNGVADIGYGIAFLVIAYTTAYQIGFSSPMLLVLLPVTLWAVRLALRIGRKNYGKPEDFRYKAWRDAWGSTFLWRSYL